MEPEAKGCGMTFNMFYIGSKYPYFISYRDKWVYFFAAGVCICKGSFSGNSYIFHSKIFSLLEKVVLSQLSINSKALQNTRVILLIWQLIIWSY